MHFLSRFIALTILLPNITQAMLVPAQQPAQSASSGTAVSKSKPTTQMPLDFTPLPGEVQKIVLGYLKTGWQVTDTIESGNRSDNIQDLYFYDDRLLVRSVGRIVTPIFFEKNIDQDFACRLEAELSDYCQKNERKADINAAHSHIGNTFDDRQVARSINRIYNLGGVSAYLSKNYIAILSRRPYGIYLFKTNEAAPDVIKEIDPKFEWFQYANGGGCYTGSAGYPCFSSDERYLAYEYTALRGFPEVRLVNLATGEVEKSFKTTSKESIGSIAISPDLKYIAAGRSVLTDMSEVLGPIVIWNMNTGNTVAVEEILENVASMTFSPDSKNLITASQAGVIRKWEYQPDLNDLK